MVTSHHGQRDSVHAHGALHHDVLQVLRFREEPCDDGIALGCEAIQRAGCLHDASHHVSGHTCRTGDRSFEVHIRARPEVDEVRTAKRLGHHVERHRVAGEVTDGEVYAVHCDRIAEAGIFKDCRASGNIVVYPNIV